MIDLETYKKSFSGKSVAFCGIGVSNKPLLSMYNSFGAHVIACDKKPRESFEGTLDDLENNGIEFRFGEDYLSGLDVDILFRTPGMNYNHPELKNLRDKGVYITSEIEEFFKLCPAYKIAVTGSDGKTTTTTIISELLKAEGKTVFLGGNIGEPLLPRIEKITEDDYVVAELSSFQLISMCDSPQTAVVTNIAPNHLDVHKDMQEYIDAKKNIFLHQSANDRLVINAENDITLSFLDDAKGEVVTFSHEKSSENCVYTEDGVITLVKSGVKTPIVNFEDIRVPGDHNVQNFMAAIAAVNDIVSVQTIVKVAKEFSGVEHRIEFVREINGVKWYNDSIATSPTRAIAGMNAFNKKLIIIAGGYDKHIPFDPFAQKAVTNSKILLLMGDTADAIEKCVKSQPSYSQGNPEIFRVNTMEEAVSKAAEAAENGDIVTLSPACASFDKYPNFAVRGRHFKKLVEAL